MDPKGSKASGEILDAIKHKFQSLERFEAEFEAAANSHFGSGWVWLVLDKNGDLTIASTHDADTPLRHGETPLMVCDVWEHAYYIDHRNARPNYVKEFIKIINWDFVNQQFKQARHKRAA
jgi:superoxide dismutase, Fe-Mn family